MFQPPSGNEDFAQIALLAVEHAADSMLTVSPEGDILSCNRAAIARLGYTRRELLTMKISDFDPNYPKERWGAHWEELRQTKNMRFETVHRTKAGHLYPAEITVWHFERDGREFACSTLRDLTAQKEQEAKRVDLERQLQIVQRMESVGLLAGGIAHDFNNSLLVIMSCAELGQKEIAGSTAVLSELFTDIRRAASHSAELSRQLLSLGRRQVLQRRVIDLNELVEAHLALMRRVIPASIELEFIPGHELGMVNVDPGQVEQVLTNLCVNARDALPSGGAITAETENVVVNGTYRDLHPWARPGRYVLLTVTDDGTGMPPEVRDRIFEPFFTTKEPGSGTGLGLSVAYGIVQQHGGFLHVYSELGMGTTFKVYLPIVERSADSVGPKLRRQGSTSRGRILLAEDDRPVRRLVTALLERAGHEVHAASDGMEALARFKAAPSAFDILILDAVMPLLGGVGLRKQVLEIRPDVPVIITSGYSAELADDPDGASQVHFVSKPYVGEELLAKIAELLG